MHALLVTHRLEGVSRAEFEELREELAPSVAAVPGLVSVSWLANVQTGRYGGLYVFDDHAAFDRFVASELFALLSSLGGISDVVATDYSVRTAYATAGAANFEVLA